MTVPGTCRLQETLVHPSVEENTEEKGGAVLRSLNNFCLCKGMKRTSSQKHYTLPLVSRWVVSDSFATLWTVSPPGSSVHGICRKNTGVGCHFLLQGIFLTGDQTHIWILYHWATWEGQILLTSWKWGFPWIFIKFCFQKFSGIMLNNVSGAG